MTLQEQIALLEKRVAELEKRLVPDKNLPREFNGFEAFWDRYPRKTGKPNALKSFNKVVKSQDQLDQILFSIDQRLEVGEWDAVNRKQFIPHPATWLNRHGWEDEVIAPAKPESRQRSVAEHNDRIISQYMSNGGGLWIE